MFSQNQDLLMEEFHTWLSETNSASSPTTSPSFNTSKVSRGVKDTLRRCGLTKPLSSNRISDVIGLFTVN